MHKGLVIEIDRKGVARDILHGSAIVCRAAPDGRPCLGENGLVDFWFEGNLNEAVNLNRFIEKITCAAGRMVTDYPTMARGAVEPERIAVLAEYDLRRNFVTRIVNPAGWQRMLEHPAQTYLAPPPPEGDMTDKAEIVAQMNKVGFRHLSLARMATVPQAYQFLDGRILLVRTLEDMQLFWPDDPRIVELRDLMPPEDYVRIEPDLNDAEITQSL